MIESDSQVSDILSEVYGIALPKEMIANEDGYLIEKAQLGYKQGIEALQQCVALDIRKSTNILIQTRSLHEDNEYQRGYIAALITINRSLSKVLNARKGQD